jgi:hypothetical protein
LNSGRISVPKNQKKRMIVFLFLLVALDGTRGDLEISVPHSGSLTANGTNGWLSAADASTLKSASDTACGAASVPIVSTVLSAGSAPLVFTTSAKLSAPLPAMRN